MRNIGSTLTIILALSILAIVPAQAAVHNIDLSPVGDSGVSGKATTIVGSVGGQTPYYNVEVNARLNKMPPENMVYEAWLVDNDADYKLSLGAFNGMQFSGRQRPLQFDGATPYDAVAVSLEPARDTNPMPTKIVALGNLPGTVVSEADFMRLAVLPEDDSFHRQIVMQRYALSGDQMTSLRMSGWRYSDIALVANVATRCNREAGDVAGMLQEGQSWGQIAQMCNTTVATLLEPVPIAAVAGFIAEVRPGMAPPVGVLMFYQRYANGRPIVTQRLWDQWRRRGYSWRDVTIAANVAAMTGESVDALLRMARIQGQTWRSIATQRGLDVDAVTDVSRWPFSRDAEAMMPVPPMPPAAISPMPPSEVPPGPGY